MSDDAGALAVDPQPLPGIRDLSQEEYDATYYAGEPHQLPAELLEYLEAIERGEAEEARVGARVLVGGDLALPYMPAASYGPQFRLPARIRIVHCTEGPMVRGAARALAGPNWFGGPAGTSAHDIFDPGEGVKMVPDDRIAWAVGPEANGFTRNSEHCGRVAMTREQWLSDDGMEMLRRSARYNAAAAHRDGVLPRWLTLTQLARKEPGFATHNDVRLVFGGTTHSDPGPNFPYDVYMDLVRDFYNGEDPDMGMSPDDWTKLGGLLADIRSAVGQAYNKANSADARAGFLIGKLAADNQYDVIRERGTAPVFAIVGDHRLWIPSQAALAAFGGMAAVEDVDPTDPRLLLPLVEPDEEPEPTPDPTPAPVSAVGEQA